MRKIGIYAWVMIATYSAASLLPVSGVAADRAADAKHRLIMQVSDNEPDRWKLALTNARNVQDDLGRDNVDIELIAYGPGLNMLKLGSAVSALVVEAVRRGVNIIACENTMANMKVGKADMLPDIDYVKAGVVELMVKQQQGWVYVRP